MVVKTRHLATLQCTIILLSGPLAAHGAAAVTAAREERRAATPTDELEALRAEIARLRQDYEARIAELERRIAELEAADEPEGKATPEKASPGTEGVDSRAEELARILAAAAAGATEEPETAPTPPSRGRSLNQLNPEISFTGDLVALARDPGREEFDAREFELDLQSSLDPFSRARLTLSVGHEGVEVEEGYITYPALAPGLGLTAGKFRQTFGAVNRQHLHALAQSEYPLALRSVFGDEGLGQTGVSVDWVIPRPWASANELTVQLTDGENDAFGGEAFERLALLAHLKNYWDLSSSTYLEWGLSGIEGRTGDGGRSRVWGTDLSLHWQPPSRAKYREITWRTEVLVSQRDDPFGSLQEAWGGYSSFEAVLRRNLSAGVRLDRATDPVDPRSRWWGYVPYLTWWQSEFVRLRGEIERREHDPGGETENRLTLQLTFAAGPHKHETY